MKKNYALILSLLLLLNIALGSCKSQNTGTDILNTTATATQAPESTQDEYEPLPIMDFKGRTLTMFLYDYMKEEHLAEELTGEVLNDAVYNRNKKIENDYNIAIKFKTAAYSDYIKNVRTSILSQDGAYDLLAFHAVSAASMIGDDLFTDWRSDPVISDNLDKPWWNKSTIDNLSIANKVYFIAGDIGYHYIGHVQAFLFNKNLFTDSAITFPYEMVRNGTWTYENFEKIIKLGNKDLNGDGKLEYDTDRFGFMSMGLFADVMYYFNFGGKIIDKDNNDYPVLVLNSPKNISILETGYRWFIENNSPLTKYEGNDDYSVELSHVSFKDNRVFILGTNLKNLRVLRNMDSDFGIIPYPKFDEKQDNYISIIDGAVPLMVLPNTSDASFVGLITEALARESYKYITPAFYESTLEQKYSRDETSQEMLKIIRDTTYFDMGYIYNFGNSGFISRQLLVDKSNNITSYIEKNINIYQKEIDKFINQTQGIQ